MVTKLKVGIIGTGNIAPAYIKGCRQFEILDLVACADLDGEKAQALASQHDLKATSIDNLLSDENIDIIINLTIPNAHAAVALQIISAGKHVYNEKPLALSREEGKKVIDAAKEAGVRVGCAPDTFLGGGGQTSRKIIDDGWIGTPVAATAFMLSHGPESWHPNPGFYYQKGGGPLFDMGPYYITALVNLLGPVRRLTASTSKSFDTRVATSEARYGEILPVEVNTHVAGTLEFASGPVATLITSFDVWAHHLPRLHVYGSQGSVSVPDPNTFRGPVSLWTLPEREWREVPMTYSTEVGRGIGVADMAYGIQTGRPHRASGDLAFHVLDVMQSLEEAAATGKHIELSTQPDQPTSLPMGLMGGKLDE